jgi:MFS family permease
MFLAGLVGFILMSALCAGAPNPGILIVGRVLLGVSAAIMLPQVLSFLNVWFTGDKRSAAFGMFGAAVGIGSLAAPLIGGALVSGNIFGLHWRSVFLLNIPIGLLILVGTVLLVSESRASHSLMRLDLVGTVISAGGVFLMVFPVIQGRQAGCPAWTWLMLALSVPVFVAFAAYELRETRKGRFPLIDPALFRKRGFSAGALVTVVFYAGVTSIAFILMIFLQEGFGYSALRGGLTSVPLAVAIVLGSIVSIGAVAKIGRLILQVGAVLSLAGVAWLSVVVGGHTGALDPWVLVAPLAITGVGLGCVTAPLADLVLAGVGEDSTGSASGIMNALIQIGGAVGVAVIGVIFFDALGGHPATHAVFSHSMQVTMYYEMGVFGLTFLLVFLLPKKSADNSQHV